MIGRTLGTYRIVEQIGMGGMATVYKAFDPDTERYVAIKVLPEHYGKDSEFYKRFGREAKAIAKLEHIHILPIFAYGEDSGIAYLVMRYMQTGTLAQHLKDGALPLPEAARLIGQIASALDYAHAQGVLHRDVKPSNILLDRNNNAYLTDFGIAKMVEGSLPDLTGSAMLGTPQYMSPEQCEGRKDLTPASDLYSLGVMLYEMMIGAPPFQAETPLAVIHMQLTAPLPPPRKVRPELPEDVERVILKALAKQPEKRYATCGAMADAFTAAIEGFTSGIQTKVHGTEEEPAHILDVSALPDEMDAQDIQTIIPAPVPRGRRTSNQAAAATSPMEEGGRRFPVWAAVLAALLALVVLGGGALASGLIRLGPPPTPTAIIEIASAPTGTPPPLAAATQLQQEAAEVLASREPLPLPVAAEGGPRILTGHEGEVTSVAFSPNGDLLASASADGTVRLWNAQTGEVSAVLDAGDDALAAVVFSSDGSLLASGGVGLGRLWNVNQQEQIIGFERGVLRALAFSPTQSLLALGGDDRVILVWDLVQGEEYALFEGHTSQVNSIAFSPDGSLIASAGGWQDGTVRLWSVADRAALNVLDTDSDSAHDVAFSPDGALLAVSTLGSVQLWDVASGEQVDSLEASAYGIAFSPDGTLLAGGSDGGVVGLLDLETGELLAALENHTGRVNDVIFSPDGMLLVSGSEDTTLELWDVTSYLADEGASDDGGVFITQAEGLIENGQLEEAITYLNGVLEQQGENAEAYIMRGNAYAGQDNNEQALADYNRAIELSPDSAWAVESRGWLYYSVGEFNAAIADFSQAITLDPNAIDAFVGRADAYQDQGDLEQAIADYTHALELDSNHLGAYNSRGYAHLNAGLLREAIADFTVVIESDPSYAPSEYTPYFGRADAYAALGDYEAAVADYQRAIEVDPGYTPAYNNQGDAYLFMDRYDEAIAAYDLVLQNEPDFPYAYTGRGHAYRGQGNYDQALADFSRSIELDDSYAFAYLGRGETYRDAGNIEPAIEDFTRAIESDGVNWDNRWAFNSADYAHLLAYLARGQAYEALGNYDAAIADYSQAVTLNPGYVEAYSRRGAVYAGLGNYEAAIADFTEALNQGGDNPEWYIYRGDAYTSSGNFDAAISDYSRAIELAPDWAWPYNNLGTAYFLRGDYEQAIADHTQALFLDPNYVDAYLRRGDDHQGLGSYGAAIADYSAAIDHDPNRADAYLSRAIAYLYGMGDVEAAIADYNRVLELAPDVREAYYGLGDAYDWQGYPQTALAYFNQALEADSSYLDAYIRRGDVYQELGDPEEALAAYDQALEIDGNSVWALFNRGNLHNQLGHYQQAIADYSRALEFDSSSVEAYTERGWAYFNLSNYDAALADFTAALERNPDFSSAYAGLGSVHHVQGRPDEAATAYWRYLDLTRGDATPDIINAAASLGIPGPSNAVMLPGNAAGWIDSGIQVTAGQTYTLTAAGEVNVFPDCENLCPSASTVDCSLLCPAVVANPNGSVPMSQIDEATALFFPLPNNNMVALVGRIGEGTPFVVGVGGEFTADSDGTLQFRVNDDDRFVGAETGAFVVWVDFASGPVLVVGSVSVSVRAEPDADAALVTEVSDVQLPITARTADGRWYRVTIGDQEGWIAYNMGVRLEGDLDGLLQVEGAGG